MIEKYLYSLLQDHDCVVVPGFGGFLARQQSASIHPITNRILPPARKAAFNEQLQLNDGLLVTALTTGQAIGQDEAMTLIKLFVTGLKQELQQQGRVELETLGVFVLTTQGKLEFTPARTQNLASDSFGLPELFYRPLDSASDSMNKLPQKTIRPAASRTQEEMQLDNNGRPIKVKKANTTAKVIGILAPVMLLIFGAGFWIMNQQPDSKLRELSIASVMSWFGGEKTDTQALAVVVTPAKTEDLTTVDSSAIVTEAPVETPAVAAAVVPAPEVVKPQVVKPVVKAASPEVTVKTAAKGRYYLVAGAFANKDNALRLQQKLAASGENVVVLEPGNNSLYKVCLGEFSSVNEAMQKKSELSGNTSVDGWWVHKN